MIKLSKEDLDELVRLNNEARRTPVIALSVKDGIEGRDLASQAWDSVAQKMEELGVKYGFDAKQIRGIDGKTGEVYQ